ncbi:hypothetical protein [Streptomyces sp. NBC_00878]|uniref:hypothetical protein n=1 Tax=Streptomyces sp. NBC_00878 TaxID=2975854 RepID=UPI00224EEE32|nr:hypothetical protein [Streptomyces sp. NBC_00878]MCX4905072.1 hypothetical protein [Streptomyces sp. NBC_00878]
MLALRLARGARPAVQLRRLLVAAASAGTGFLLLCTLGYAMGHPDASGAALLRLAWCVAPLAATVQFAVAVARTDPATRPRQGLSAIGLGPARLTVLAAVSTAVSCTLGSLVALLLFLHLRGDLTGLPFDGDASGLLAADEPLPLPAALTLLTLVPIFASAASAAVLRPRGPRPSGFMAGGRPGRPGRLSGFGGYGRSAERVGFGAYGRFGARAGTREGAGAGARPEGQDGPGGQDAADGRGGAADRDGAEGRDGHGLRPGGPGQDTPRRSGRNGASGAKGSRGRARDDHADNATQTGQAAQAAQAENAGQGSPGAPLIIAALDVPRRSGARARARVDNRSHGTDPSGTRAATDSPAHDDRDGHKGHASHNAPGHPATPHHPDSPGNPGSPGSPGLGQPDHPGHPGHLLDPQHPPAPLPTPGGLPWGAAVLAAGLAVETYAGRAASSLAGPALPGGFTGGPIGVLVGWALTAFGLALAGPAITHLCGRLLQAVRPGALRLLAGRVLMEEAARIGQPLGVLCAVASGVYAMAVLYGSARPDVGPLTTLGALLVAGCAVATLLTAAVEARHARADTAAALLRLGAPATTLRVVAALRAGALLAVFGPLTWAVAELAAAPLTR